VKSWVSCSEHEQVTGADNSSDAICLCYVPHGKLCAAISGTRIDINIKVCVKQTGDKDKFEVRRSFNSEYFDSKKLHGFITFRWDISVVLGRITGIGKMQSDTTFNSYIAKRFYIACLNNYMFRPLYRPSSGCTFSYFKANYTINNVFVFVNEISCTFIKLTFKICI
jgi:hypothetical protein